MIGNIKRLIAIDKKYYEAPVYICAKEDPRTKTLVDYEERLTKAEKEGLNVKLDGDTQLRVSHLMTFDLANPNDRIHFEIVSDDNMVAPNKESVNPGTHRYYVEDREAEASQAISKTRLKAKAFKIVALLSLDDMINYARILGKYARNLSGTQVEALLYEICEDKPKQLIDIADDRDLKYKILLSKLMDESYVSIVNGKYMNGNDPIGINENYAIQWLKDPKNSVIITQWVMAMGGEPPSIAEDVKDSVEDDLPIVKKSRKKSTKA